MASAASTTLVNRQRLRVLVCRSGLMSSRFALVRVLSSVSFIGVVWHWGLPEFLDGRGGYKWALFENIVLANIDTESSSA